MSGINGNITDSWARYNEPIEELEEYLHYLEKKLGYHLDTPSEEIILHKIELYRKAIKTLKI